MGFSDPNPADDETDEETLTEMYESIPDDPDIGDDLALVSQDASCEDCSHRGVCSIYNNFAQRMAQSFGSDTPGADAAPVDPERLAWHCELYDPEDDAEAETEAKL